MNTEKNKGIGFHHIGLIVKNLAASVAFYEALGMKSVCGWGTGCREVCMLDIGDGGRMELFASDGAETADNGKWVHLALRTDDVDSAYKTALEAGAQPHDPPKTVCIEDARPRKLTLRIAFVKGPDGEILEFFSEI